ncbi:MAG TPA: hypothetical protein DCK93_06925 [Blastocatellia bacterium]|nr:hypothetical protein [Blastocatellia bacterium]
MLDQTLDLKEKLTRVLDRATHEAIALVLAQPETGRAPAEPLLGWMTATQLARYWQLVNANDEPTTAGIMKWVKRAENEHPLPHAYMGDLVRFNRDEVDVWAREEARRRRVQSEQRRLKIA